MPLTTTILPWRQISTDLIAAAPGVPSPVAMKVMREAAVQFCKETTAWRMTLDPLTLFKDVREYEINPPLGVQADIYLVTELEGIADFEFEPPFLIRLAKSPRKDDDTRELRAAMIPARNSEGLVEQFWNRHHDGILHGALWRLYRMPGQDWSDLNAAIYQEQCFVEHVTKARNDMGRSNQTADLRARPQRFF